MCSLVLVPAKKSKFNFFSSIDSMTVEQEKLITQTESVSNQLGGAINLTDGCTILHPTLDPESKITFGSLTPERLSPNLFLSLSLDSIAERNNMDIEWTTYTESIPTTSYTISLPHQQQHLELSMSPPSTVATSFTHQSHYIRSTLSNPNNPIDMNNCLNLDNVTSPYDEIKYIGVDHFNHMENFRNDCIFSMNDTDCLNDKDIEVSEVLSKETSEELDLHESFEMHDSMEKTVPLLDLEKPIINISMNSSVFNVHPES